MNTKLRLTDLNQPTSRDRHLACRSLLNATLKMASEIGFIALAGGVGICLMASAAQSAIGSNTNNANTVSDTKIDVVALSAGINNATDPAAILRARFPGLRDRLNTNGFQRPIVLDSFHTSDDVKGEIYALVPTRFAKVNESLAMPQAWCDILILHLNTKFCRVVMPQQASGQLSSTQADTKLVMNVGKKFDRPLDESYRLTFAWQLADQKADYLRVQLNADEGPLSTRDYRITLEAIPLPAPLLSQLALSNFGSVPPGAIAGSANNGDRKSTRLNSSHHAISRMPSSA